MESCVRVESRSDGTVVIAFPARQKINARPWGKPTRQELNIKD